jgi:two-component sensor histidine kinase
MSTFSLLGYAKGIWELPRSIILPLFSHCRIGFLGTCLLVLSVSHFVSGQSVADLLQEANRQLYISADSSLHYYHLAESKALVEGPQDSLFGIYDALVGFYQVQGDHVKEGHYAALLLDAASTEFDQGMALVALARYFEKDDPEKCDSLYQEAEILSRKVEGPALRLAVKANYGQFKLLKADFYGGITDMIEVTKLQPDDFVTAQMYNKIATALHFLDRPDLAEEYVHKAIDLANEKGYQYGKGMPMVTLAGLRMDEQDYAAAQTILSKSFEYAQLQKNQTLLVAVLMHRTQIYLEQGLLDQATASIAEAKSVYDQVSTISRCNLLNIEGQLMLAQGRNQEVVSLGEEVMKLMDDRLPMPARLQAYTNMATAFEKLGDNQSALQYFRQSRALEDSIFRTRQTYYFNELEARFNRNQKTQELALLDAQNELQATRIKQQSRLLLYGGLALFVIIGLLAFLAQLVGRVRTQNQVITAALAAKEVLMREIHHRVKNNLQLISSLLSLQSRYVADPEAREILQAGKDRVRSMSIIHQDLYRGDILTAVNVKDYLNKLSRELVSSYEQKPNQIAIYLDVEPLDLDVDTLVPLGLIVNELLTNAFKYAFPQGQRGKIWLRLWEAEEKLHLEVQDDGVGFEEEAVRDAAFGHKLIKTLITQLDGDLEKVKQEGTYFKLRFGLYKKF